MRKLSLVLLLIAASFTGGCTEAHPAIDPAPMCGDAGVLPGPDHFPTPVCEVEGRFWPNCDVVDLDASN